MNQIRTLSGLVDTVVNTCDPKRIAVANAHDPNTFGAVVQGIRKGLINAVMTGQKKEIEALAKQQNIDPGLFEILNVPEPEDAVKISLDLVRNNEADILMKGLVGTDVFLRAVLDKDEGLMIPGKTLSYVCALEVPGLDRLLFVTDTAVLPFPDLRQKTDMVGYAVSMARMFGVGQPKVALIEPTEKVTPGIPETIDDALICKMAEQGRFGTCTVDGPLDIFLACDPEAAGIKKVPNRINGEADVLVFPSLSAANVFYKGLVRFSGAELAGLIQGTSKPVVVMSRSESVASKFFCIALAVLTANTQNK